MIPDSLKATLDALDPKDALALLIGRTAQQEAFLENNLRYLWRWLSGSLPTTRPPRGCRDLADTCKTLLRDSSLSEPFKVAGRDALIEAKAASVDRHDTVHAVLLGRPDGAPRSHFVIERMNLEDVGRTRAIVSLDEIGATLERVFLAAWRIAALEMVVGRYNRVGETDSLLSRIRGHVEVRADGYVYVLNDNS